MTALAGRKALVVGIANAHSIATGCARAFRAAGAELAVTYLNDKAAPYVRPIAEDLGAALFLPLDVTEPGAIDAVFDRVEEHWGRLDILLHSIAFAPRADLHGRVVDCSLEGFTTAMDVSVHSFVRMVRRAEPLMAAGGACLTVSFLGAQRVVPNYNIMGPVKAALEAVTREMAAELGAQGIRVNAISPGPLATRAASGIAQFDAMLQDATARAPLHTVVDIDDCGALAAFLASDGARRITGGVHYVDGGYNVIA